MKNSILSLLLIFSTNTIYSQSNLEFSQAIFGELSGSVGSTADIVGTITVPAGKVWKLEKVSVVSDDYFAFTGQMAATINGLLVYSTAPPSPQSVVWLPQGTYTVRITVTQVNQYRFAYSGIEFFVAP